MDKGVTSESSQVFIRLTSECDKSLSDIALCSQGIAEIWESKEGTTKHTEVDQTLLSLCPGVKLSAKQQWSSLNLI